MTHMLTSSPQSTNLLVLPDSTAGSYQCVCLHTEQPERGAEETTGLIIGHVRRRRTNKRCPHPTEEL